MRGHLILCHWWRCGSILFSPCLIWWGRDFPLNKLNWTIKRYSPLLNVYYRSVCSQWLGLFWNLKLGNEQHQAMKKPSPLYISFLFPISLFLSTAPSSPLSLSMQISTSGLNSTSFISWIKKQLSLPKQEVPTIIAQNPSFKEERFVYANKIWLCYQVSVSVRGNIGNEL